MKRASKANKWFQAVAVVAVCAVAAVGCAPAAATDLYWGYEERSELEAWAAEEIDITIEATGIGPEGWALELGDEAIFWDTDRELVLENAPRSTCLVDGDYGVWPGRLQFIVRHDGRPDAFAIAEYVRARWTVEGWIVSDIIRPEELPNWEHPFIYIRADREDEHSGLSFRANANTLSIGIYSACSEDSTMAW